jgi:hypothetical protein
MQNLILCIIEYLYLHKGVAGRPNKKWWKEWRSFHSDLFPSILTDVENGIQPVGSNGVMDAIFLDLFCCL